MIKKRRIQLSGLLSLLLSLVLMIYLVGALTRTGQRYTKESAERLKESIQNAAVSCYSIEGFYPSNVEYLEEHYGIIIDSEHYYVFYESLGANMVPTVEVVNRKG